MRRFLRHAQSLVRFESRPPAIGAGLRAALAVSVPFTLASLLGLPGAGWTGLTGLLVSLADQGGAYHARARAMGTLTVLGAGVGLLAAVAGGHRFELVLLAAGVFVLTYARCYGETAGALGSKLAVIFVASLGVHADGWPGALERGLALLLGGTWATLQSLVFWPLRPFRPARRSVAAVYTGLASAADELAQFGRRGGDPRSWEEATARHAGIRPVVEHARATLAEIRKGQPAESARGEHLLVLLESSEPSIGALSGLAQATEVAIEHAPLRPVGAEVATACEAYAGRMRWVAASLERDPAAGFGPAVRAEANERREQPPSPLQLARPGLPGSTNTLLTRLERLANANLEATLSLLHGRPARRAIPPPSREPGERRRVLLEPLRQHLTRDSLVLRHALRTAVVAAAALACARSLQLREAHWVVLSAIGTLQPHTVSTEVRALERGLGTFLGGMLAVALATAVESPYAMIAATAVLTAISVSLLPLNFGAFQALLTPDLLLLASLHAGDWSVAAQRAIGVVVACGLALASVWLLWSSPERRRFPDTAAEVLRADGRYLRTVAELLDGRDAEVEHARRELGLVLIEAEASLGRLMAETHRPGEQLEPAMAVLTYSRRLIASVSAIGAEGHAAPAPPVRNVVAEASGVLDSLADSLQERRPPPPVPTLPSPRKVDDPISGALLERVPRQLGVLHGAVTRLSEEATRD